ncbi:MAG: hypothetical protein BHW59_04670 [Desulfovibrio piger]|nr:MAG: hypothetical protein BHW59_04670 [Desulfovibrio piger]
MIGTRASGTRAGTGTIMARAATVMDAGAGSGTVTGAMIAGARAVGTRTGTVVARTGTGAITRTVITGTGSGAVAGTMVPGAGSGRGALLVMSLGTGLILMPAFMTAVVVAGHQGPGHPVSDMLRGLSFIRKSERGHTGQGQGRQQQTKVLCAHGKTPCESGATRCGQLCPTFPA